MANGTTVVVIRDGRVIWRRFTPAPPLVPRKGTVMADTATTTTTVTEGHRWALLLQAREKAAATKAAVATGSAKALAKAKEGLEFIQSSPAYGWFQRIFTRALGMTRGLADTLGTAGVIALVVSVVLSRQGRKAIRWVTKKAADLSLSALGYTVAGISKVISWIPRKGKAWSARFDAAAMRATAKVIGWSMGESKLSRVTRHLHSDAPVGRGLQVGATTYVLLKLGTAIIAGLPGLTWKLASSAVLAVGMGVYAHRVGAFRGLRILGSRTLDWMIAFRKNNNTESAISTETVEKVVDAPAGPIVKTVVHNPNGVQLASNAMHIAAEIGNEIAVEKHQAAVKAAGESAQAVRNSEVRLETTDEAFARADTGKLLASAEASSEKARSLVADTNAIARVTADFFDEEMKYTSREQLLNDLKGRVYPLFKHHLNSKLTSKAARGFAVLMADKFGEGDGLYGEPGSNTQLRELVATEALSFIDNPLRTRQDQLVSA